MSFSSGLRFSWREPALWVLIALASAIYFTRISDVSIRGEEPRWGTVAREMAAEGDWVVPRQQGQVFVDRPPMGSWAMAAVAGATGRWDALAVRLPSALAVFCTTLLVYGYCRRFLSETASFAAAAAFCVLPQTLQLGRVGENDALYMGFVAAGFLLWHAQYMDRGADAFGWVCGYVPLAFAMLTKGVQAPAAFFLTVGLYLYQQGRLRDFFRPAHLVGIAAFVAIIAPWNLLFSTHLDHKSGLIVWLFQVLEKVVNAKKDDNGLLRFVRFPWEQWAMLMPWSALWFCWLSPKFREAARPKAAYVWFCAIGMLVGFSTIWFAVMGVSRYFMSFLPLGAVVVGVALDVCWSQGTQSPLWAPWKHFARTCGVMAVLTAVCIALLGTGVVPGQRAASLAQPPLAATAIVLGAAAVCWLLWVATLKAKPKRLALAVAGMAAFIGLVHTKVAIDASVKMQNDAAPAVAAVAEQLPPGAKLYSLGTVHHLFRWHYPDSVTIAPKADSIDALPPEVEYFCYNDSGLDALGAAAETASPALKPPTTGQAVGKTFLILLMGGGLLGLAWAVAQQGSPRWVVAGVSLAACVALAHSQVGYHADPPVPSPLADSSVFEKMASVSMGREVTRNDTFVVIARRAKTPQVAALPKGAKDAAAKLKGEAAESKKAEASTPEAKETSLR